MSDPDDLVPPEVYVRLSSEQVAQIIQRAGGVRDIMLALHDRDIAVAITNLLQDSEEITGGTYSRSLLLGLSILATFAQGNRERGVVDIAEETGLTTSTTHRYLTTLHAAGLLERNPTTRKYRPSNVGRS